MVECTGLENRRTERYRGFESLSLRTESCKSKDLQDFFIIIMAYPSKITFTTNNVVYTFSISFHTNHLQRFSYSIYIA